MHLNFDISPRDALAAPASDGLTYFLSIVIVVVSTMSAVGAGWIMLSFACFKKLRAFRHQLILGLAVSDCLMALNFLSSSAMNLGGKFIGAPEQQGFCSFNGYMTQVFVIQTDYWVLVIAMSTYFILADYKRAASWVQDHRKLLASLPWVFSVLWASIGLGVTGYGNIGAWCWFTSDEVRLLVNFIPRWIIIAGMLIVYTRLYFILFRARRFISSNDEESSADRSNNRASSSGRYTRGAVPPNSRKLKKLARLMIMYPIAYMLIWTLPTCVRIYQARTGKAAPFALQTVDKACIVLQGVVDAIIYGVNESSLASWRALVLPEKVAYPPVNGLSASLTAMLAVEEKERPAHVPGRLRDDADAMVMLEEDDSTSSSNVARQPTNGLDANLAAAGMPSGSRGKAGTKGRDEVELCTFAKRTGGSGITRTVEVNVMSTEAGEAKSASVMGGQASVRGMRRGHSIWGDVGS
ncbi:hypothetical protein BR93DRAFT_227053 [Coniochaeta sp. PMI_546]|nr:hypothetical protein BR93DRAFT_227053 [Coniochaeta sp. PMI_546]